MVTGVRQRHYGNNWGGLCLQLFTWVEFFCGAGRLLVLVEVVFSLAWLVLCKSLMRIWLSYTLSREYRVMRYRYSRLLFTSEDRLCANLRVQEQSTNMTSQCQCPTFAWRHRSTVKILNQKRLFLATMAKSALDNCFSGKVCSGHQIACKN